jgi:hypothetical protein
MIQRKIGWITIIDVIRDMGLEPNDTMDWAVGLRFAKWFYEFTGGMEPEKWNRNGTKDSRRVHCFAHYPECFRHKMESMVREYKFEQSRQTRFAFMDNGVST